MLLQNTIMYSANSLLFALFIVYSNETKCTLTIGLADVFKSTHKYKKY